MGGRGVRAGGGGSQDREEESFPTPLAPAPARPTPPLVYDQLQNKIPSSTTSSRTSSSSTSSSSSPASPVLSSPSPSLPTLKILPEPSLATPTPTHIAFAASAASAAAILDKKPSATNIRSDFRSPTRATAITRKPTADQAAEAVRQAGAPTITNEFPGFVGTKTVQDDSPSIVSSAFSDTTAHVPRSLSTPSLQSSHRIITAGTGGSVAASTASGSGSSSGGSGSGAVGAGGPRRQGRVFKEAFPDPNTDGSAGGLTSTPPPPPRQSSLRPRTRTLDAPSVFRQTQPAHTERHRVASVSSGTALTTVSSESLAGSLTTCTAAESIGIPSIVSPVRAQAPAVESAMALAGRDRKPSGRRLIKRTNSRPTSPLVSPPPYMDSLPLPIPTANANHVLQLMRNLCGRMRGEIEYSDDPEGGWCLGMGYIEEERGSLMFDTGDNYHVPIVPDLRGCRVLPVELPGSEVPCLEIAHLHPGGEIYVRPVAGDEFDLWLAALLSWQQMRPGPVKPGSSRGNSTPTPDRSEPRRRGSSNRTKESTIIKVGKVKLWDKGLATSPRAIAKRPSTRDLRSIQTSWRRVSCILQDNGEFRLMTENDVTVLAVIELAQLSRCAIQQLDKSVLDDEFCLGILPIYAPTSTQLSIFRPLYIALDSKVLFEVWYVLLRAFTMPDMYALDRPHGLHLLEVTDFESDYKGSEIFRIEKTITLRVTEAKLKPRDEHTNNHRLHGKNEPDPLVGNYLAEVILDGEVRARTTTQTDTKNPFWREHCVFSHLPATLPYLSVVLKRQEASAESLSHQLQASLGLPRSGNLVEVVCGSVDIPLAHLDQGKDHEQWLQIYDSKQQSIGSMLAKVHHEELAVLRGREYQPLSDLLHRFSTQLTVQISDALPGNLRRVAEILVNIFQVSGSASEWLMALVEDEIDGIGNQATIKKMRYNRRLKSVESVESASDREQLVRDMSKSLAGEANLLFRGNSLLTQSLEFHMRRLGGEYIEEVLGEKVHEINDLNPNCEVDPSKVQAGEDVQMHWNQLVHITGEIWECIASSAHKMPQELRQILKYVRAVAEDRYGDFLRTVAYTSVSGFLFLRFICPAILNPKLFGILRDHPRPRAQRTLTLIAKGLQALANLSTIGKKETWMEPMNRFLNSHRQSVKDFIDTICAVPAERPGVFVPPASYSTPITIVGRLPPVAREGLPSLPHLIDLPRNYAALVRLWTDSHRATAGPGGGGSGSGNPALEGDLLLFHETCVALSKRAAECAARVEAIRAAESASQAAAEDALSSLAEALDSTSLMLDGSTAGSSWYNEPSPYAGGARPPGSAGSDVTAAYNSNSSHGLHTHQRGASSADLRNYSASRDHWGRQISYGSDASGSVASGTAASASTSAAATTLGGHANNAIRGLRNGRQARKFLSGLIKKSRTASPDTGGVSPAPKDRGAGDAKENSRHYFGVGGHHHLHHHNEDSNGDRERSGGDAKDGAKHKDKDKDKDKDKSRDKDKDRSGSDKDRDKKADRGRERKAGSRDRDTSISSKTPRSFGFGHLGAAPD
ncbi:hypothetical protein RB601_009119 [Gaeumannomyces tritici]